MHVHHPSSFAILPRPRSITSGTVSFLLTRDTAIVTNAQTREEGELPAAALSPALGFSLPVLPGASPAAGALVLDTDPGLGHLGTEGYRLVVTPQQVTISGATATGVFYGTQTLRQLLPA